MRYFAIIAAIALSSAASAQSLGDRIHRLPTEEWIFQGLNVADKVVTYDCVKVGKCAEGNPLLGRNPGVGKLVGAGIAEGAIHMGVTMLLQERNAPPRLIKVWEITSISAGTGIVAWNLHLRFK